MITALTNSILLTEGSSRPGKAVLINHGKITGVINDTDIPQEAKIIDLEGNFLAPALIDLQIYGSGGMLFGGNPSAAALAQLEADLLRQGTTGFLATVATNTPDIVVRAIEAAKAYRPHAKGNFWGLHLEGPYMNPKRRGAHPAHLVKKATREELESWIGLAEGEIRMITLAPELQDPELLDYIASQGILISCGHSDATYEQASGFLNRPVHAATHLFNAMPPMHHREPGLIPAIFEQQPFTSVVADGIHVSFPMISLAKRLLGDKLFLITDAVTAAQEGAYQHVFTGDRYTMPDGTLSGSCLTLLQAVKNCVEHAEIDLAEAINMASLYPAQLIGKAGTHGKISKNYTADLVAFNDKYEITGTWVSGNAT